MKKLILAAMAAAMLFTAPTMASAEEPVDMSKLSCKEFLSADQSKIGMMLMWIDGYMSGKSDNTMMDNAWMEKLGTHMGKYCASKEDHHGRHREHARVTGLPEATVSVRGLDRGGYFYKLYKVNR